MNPVVARKLRTLRGHSPNSSLQQPPPLRAKGSDSHRHQVQGSKGQPAPQQSSNDILEFNDWDRGSPHHPWRLAPSQETSSKHMVQTRRNAYNPWTSKGSFSSSEAYNESSDDDMNEDRNTNDDDDDIDVEEPSSAWIRCPQAHKQSNNNEPSVRVQHPKQESVPMRRRSSCYPCQHHDYHHHHHHHRPRQARSRSDSNTPPYQGILIGSVAVLFIIQILLLCCILYICGRLSSSPPPTSTTSTMPMAWHGYGYSMPPPTASPYTTPPPPH